MTDPKVERILEIALLHTSQVIDIDSFFVALYNRVTVELNFPLAVRKEGQHLHRVETGGGQWRSRPYQPELYLPDCIFRDGQATLIERDFAAWIDEHNVVYPGDQQPRTWLGVPLRASGRVVGVFVLENYEREQAYDERTRHTLSAITDRTAGALANARLVESLRAVNEVGQRLTSGIYLEEDQILELIREQASRLMDTRNMYIALYDKEEKQLSFPLAMFQGERDNWPSRPVEIDDLTKGGLTEEVIRSKAPLCPPNVEAWFDDRGIDPPVKPIPQSWLGVPLMVRDDVLGVIALQNDDVENLYGRDDREVLQTMANQAAVAIENARLYSAQEETIDALEEAQDEIRQLERVRTISNLAADFVHRINNMAGTIPIRLQRIYEILDEEPPKTKEALLPFLEGIENDTEELLTASQRVQALSREVPRPELIDISSLVESLTGEVRLQTSRAIVVNDNLVENLPPVQGVETELEEAVRDVINNAVEAMGETGGELTISTAYRPERAGRGWVEIEVEDTGPGIPEDKLTDIFGLFYTTKESGLGYGLWRTQSAVEAIGGQVSVDSEIGKGTRMLIQLPAATTPED